MSAETPNCTLVRTPGHVDRLYIGALCVGLGDGCEALMAELDADDDKRALVVRIVREIAEERHAD